MSEQTNTEASMVNHTIASIVYHASSKISISEEECYVTTGKRDR